MVNSISRIFIFYFKIRAKCCEEYLFNFLPTYYDTNIFTQYQEKETVTLHLNKLFLHYLFLIGV